MAIANNKTTNIFIPVKSIVNGMIILDNNERVTGVKISPKNIAIMEPGAQNYMIDTLKTVYDTMDYEFWFIAADRPVDINAYLSGLQVLYGETSNPIRKKLIMQDINKANMYINNNVVDVEFYFLFKEKDNDVCLKRIKNIIGYFSQAGMNSTQTTNDDLRVILDNFLNGGKTTTFGTVVS